MCIIIDTNVFGDVFNKESKSYLEFEPVINWIRKGKGKIVYGGTKYKKELGCAKKYLKILVEFEKMNKVVSVDDGKVDARENEIKKENRHRDFNDEHIIAIVIVSGCVLVCTKDSSAVPFIKDPAFYPTLVSWCLCALVAKILIKKLDWHVITKKKKKSKVL